MSNARYVTMYILYSTLHRRFAKKVQNLPSSIAASWEEQGPTSYFLLPQEKSLNDVPCWCGRSQCTFSISVLKFLKPSFDKLLLVKWVCLSDPYGETRGIAWNAHECVSSMKDCRLTCTAVSSVSCNWYHNAYSALWLIVETINTDQVHHSLSTMLLTDAADAPTAPTVSKQTSKSRVIQPCVSPLFTCLQDS